MNRSLFPDEEEVQLFEISGNLSNETTEKLIDIADFLLLYNSISKFFTVYE